jgi:DNA-binding NarL/FixJ family response regulator
VLIADDHAMFVETLRGFLSSSCEVLGNVEDGEALLEALDKLDPDVVT